MAAVHKARHQILEFAKQKLKLPSETKLRVVALLAVNDLDRAGVCRKADRWEVLNEFYRLHHGGQGPVTSPKPRLRKQKRASTSVDTRYNAARPCWAKPVADVPVNSDAFLRGFEWRRLRMSVLVERGARCECCGATAKDGVRIHVDHIKPRSRYPELALVKSNLQVLCAECNHGKGSLYENDWRETATGTVQ